MPPLASEATGKGLSAVQLGSVAEPSAQGLVSFEEVAVYFSEEEWS